MATSSPSLDAELAHQVLQSAPTVIYVYDLERERSVFQNRRFGELLGHPPDERDERPSDWTRHIHPDDAKLFPEHREKLKTIRPGETLFWEFRMRDSDGQWRWFLSRDVLLSGDRQGTPRLIVGSAFEITEQKQAEQHKELLADEMRHRARNFVSLVQAIGRMSRPKGLPEVNKHLDVFMGRLLTILNTGGIVLSSNTRTADLKAILRTTLEPFATTDIPSRITADGPGILLAEYTAGGMALAFHELTTNAIKYGALSTDQGSIDVRWRIEGNKFSMEWTERDGPPVQPPAAEGFGTMVIRQSVARERGHSIALDYRPEGLCCSFAFELAQG